MKKALDKKFFQRDPEIVAKELLGKILVRRHNQDSLDGLVVETEAYFGLSDPASRACNGLKNYNKLMWEEPGRLFIYNVHKYLMLNIVAHEVGKIGAVLIRAIEPISGIEKMRKNRGTEKIHELASGPGKLTISLDISRNLNGIMVTDENSEVFVADTVFRCEIDSSHRIGVRIDLEKNLRFFVKNSKFLSII